MVFVFRKIFSKISLVSEKRLINGNDGRKISVRGRMAYECLPRLTNFPVPTPCSENGRAIFLDTEFAATNLLIFLFLYYFFIVRVHRLVSTIDKFGKISKIDKFERISIIDKFEKISKIDFVEMQTDDSEVVEKFNMDDNEDTLLEDKNEESIDVMFYTPLVNLK